MHDTFRLLVFKKCLGWRKRTRIVCLPTNGMPECHAGIKIDQPPVAVTVTVEAVTETNLRVKGHERAVTQSPHHQLIL